MKNKKLPSIVILLILTLITVIFWLSFSVLRAFKSDVPEQVPENVMEPLNPNLDTKTIDQILNRNNSQQ